MSKNPSEPEISSATERNKDTVCTMSRRDRRRAETRERLYAAAVRLLSDHEFDAVTIEMVTEAADVGKGTFFNYFKNKEAILSYYFESQLRVLKETLHASPSVPAPKTLETDGIDPRGGGPFWRKITAIVLKSAERRDKEKHFTRTLLALSLTNPRVRTANVEFRRNLIQVICELIVDAQNQGEIRADVPAQTLAEFMFNVHLGAVYMWTQSEENESLHDAINRAYARVWSGIRHDGETAARADSDETVEI